METMNIENKAYKLTEDDKNKIDACLRRHSTVWDAIKEIAIKKFDSYLEQLEPTCNTDDRRSEFDCIKQRWDAVKNDEDKKAKHIETNQFDDDLVRVLMAYAERIGGIHTPNSREKNPWKMNLKANINNWQKNQTMERDTLFKIAVGFGLTIEETQRLIFTVLPDDDQLDFNPRLANEMIYAYAIIHHIPLTAEIISDGQPVQLLSVKKMIAEGQNIYLHRMFGNDYEGCYPKLIEICENRLNIFDSYNMTSCAFWLALINLKNQGFINAELDDVSDSDKEKSKDTKKRPQLEPSKSVMSCCYNYAINSDKSAKAPDLKKVQRSKAEFTKMLGLIGELINRGRAKLYQLSESSEVKKSLYEAMADYIEKLKLYVAEKPEDSNLSPLDLIHPLKESGLGKFTRTDFGEMIDNVIIKKLRRYNDIYNGKKVSNTNDVSLNNEEFEYYLLLLDSLKIAFRDLQAITQRDYLYLSGIYSEMNKILYYPYFDPEGIGMEIYDYENEKSKSDFPYTYTIEKLEYALEDADYIEDHEEFLKGLLNDRHCYEMYDHKRLSRGKEEFVEHLASEPYIISDSCSDTDGMIPLFCSEAKGTSEDRNKDKYFRKGDGHKDLLDAFYDINKFRDQFVNKSVPYKRKDILKLVFWSFAYNPEYAQITDPEDRVLNFKDYFNGLSSDDEWNAAIEKTQCAMINENNSLDRLLILCAEHSDPIGFLEAAYKLYGKNLKKIF